MTAIEISREIVDKALVALVDESRSTVAVWKGRSRIDVHTFGGALLETMRPYTLDEEGTWSRDDVAGYAVAALAMAQPMTTPTPPAPELTMRVDVGDLRRSRLTRATAHGYALWDGNRTIELYTPNGVRIRAVPLPPRDLPGVFQHMQDLLDEVALSSPARQLA